MGKVLELETGAPVGRAKCMLIQVGRVGRTAHVNINGESFELTSEQAEDLADLLMETAMDIAAESMGADHGA